MTKNNTGIKYDEFGDAWLGLGDTNEIVKHHSFFNPLTHRTDEDRENPGVHELQIMSNPEYLGLAAKVLLGINLLPEQLVILYDLWTRPFPMLIMSRGAGKSFLLAVYAMLKLILTPSRDDGSAGCKIVIVGAAFRQSKIIYEYMNTIWENAPILRSICDGNSGTRGSVDRCTVDINKNWAIAIPLGNGDKIRGLRATIIITDEFSSVPPNIYETVVGGFASVVSDPMAGVQQAAMKNALKKRGKFTKKLEEELQTVKGNQSIISGTAGFSFNHFADYWKKYKAYISSGGDTELLRTELGDKFDEDNMEGINPDDYSIIRIPIELVPQGFMDDKIIARAKATIHSGIYLQEYGAVFADDSDGFFKRSLIESCVANQSNVQSPHWPNWCPQEFDAKVRGTGGLKYVMGVDPASETDNFSIVVLELHPGHSRIVYVWTTNKKDFIERKNRGLTDISDFYGFCARKIRDLARIFPLAEGHPLGASIGIDAQGGGVAVSEALHDKDKLREGEKPFWPVINPLKKGEYDLEAGEHILDMVQFARTEWTAEANHGLRKDLEDRALLFPRFDSVTLEMALAEDKFRAEDYEEKYGKKLTLYDTLEDAVMEIEELKNELTTITMTRTGTGVGSRDRWDVPEIKLDNGKKGRLRKDRYSSLVIANMIARQIFRAPSIAEYEVIGGFATDIRPEDAKTGTPLYKGPDWFTKGANQGFLGLSVHRGV